MFISVIILMEMKIENEKLHYKNPKGKFIVSPQEQRQDLSFESHTVGIVHCIRLAEILSVCLSVNIISSQTDVPILI